MVNSRKESWAGSIPVETSDPRPIWSQIEEGVRRLIASGTLAPRDALPSVRELATSLRVNPATVSRAYQRLAGSGLVEVLRGDGTYVSAAPPALRRSEQARVVRQAALTFASLAITHGAPLEAAHDALDQAWTELDSKPEGGGR